MQDVIDFYKQAFKAQGLVEREILFSKQTTTFSMVFDGDPSGKAIVVQGVVIQDKVNVNNPLRRGVARMGPGDPISRPGFHLVNSPLYINMSICSVGQADTLF